ATAPPTRRLATNTAAVGPARGATYSITRAPARDVPDRRTPRTSVTLRGESRATLRPAPGEDGAAGARAHPDPESVGLLATADVRLEGLLHGDRLRSIPARGAPRAVRDVRDRRGNRLGTKCDQT